MHRRRETILIGHIKPFCIMKRNAGLLIVVVLLAAICGGCTPSLVYSPSVLLPARPLQKEQGELTLGAGMLPETRPASVDRSAVAGGDLLARYAFSDRLTLGVKTWADLSGSEDETRWGALIEGIVMLSEASSGYRLALMPRTGMVLSNGSIEGGGVTVPLALWTPPISSVHPYGALGPIVGWRDLSASPTQLGYGVIGNVGASLLLSELFSLKAELAGIFQFNDYDNASDLLVAPSVALSWTF